MPASRPSAGPTGFEAPKPIELLLKPEERWYRLRRVSSHTTGKVFDRARRSMRQTLGAQEA